MKKLNLTLVALLALSLVLMAWGYSGHTKINGNAELSFNQEMEEFHTWVSDLINHASDADDRKQWDPDEGVRHYIDIDKYAEFFAGGTIPQNIDSAIAIYGSYWVYDTGVLPWASLNTYDSLVACFLRLDWDKAVLFAADLGHYVGDGHMPLHITENYNGQFTGNTGIHSRYESTMINTYGNQILYEGDSISFISDVNQYIFDYLYFNYTYVDSVLEADDYAKSVNSNTSSSAYKQALWEKTRGFTTMLFKHASHALTELIYSAWSEAGKPSLSSSAFISGPQKQAPQLLEQNAPNPFFSSTHISFTLPQNSNISLEVKDTTGKTIDTLLKGSGTRGRHEMDWTPKEIPDGIYFLVLKTNNTTEVRKMLLIR